MRACMDNLQTRLHHENVNSLVLGRQFVKLHKTWSILREIQRSRRCDHLGAARLRVFNQSLSSKATSKNSATMTTLGLTSSHRKQIFWSLGGYQAAPQ